MSFDQHSVNTFVFADELNVTVNAVSLLNAH